MKMMALFINFHWMLFLRTMAIQDQSDPGPLIEAVPIKFSFNTPGWYFLGALLLFVTSLLVIKVIKNYKKNAYRRKAIEKLGHIENLNQKGSDYVTMTQLFALLKNVAFQAYGRNEVAGMYGSEWLTFLESKATNVSFNKYQEDIYRAVYKEEKVSETVIGELVFQSKKWIQTHA